MSGDRGLREALAAGLPGGWGFSDEDRDELAAALLPVVEAECRRRAAEAPCPTCVREGGPYRCCVHCADDPGAHEDGQHDHHDLPCQTCVRATPRQR